MGQHYYDSLKLYIVLIFIRQILLLVNHSDQTHRFTYYYTCNCIYKYCRYTAVNCAQEAYPWPIEIKLNFSLFRR